MRGCTPRFSARERSPRPRREADAHAACGAKRRGSRATTIGDPAALKRPDLVKRDFTATAPTACGRRFHVSAHLGGARLLRVHHRRVLADDRRLAARHPCDRPRHALRMALATRSPARHSRSCAYDHGRNTSARTTRRAHDAKVLTSVGSVGDAYDNAMPKASSTRSRPSYPRSRLHSNTKLELAIVEYVAWFNTRRCTARSNRPPVSTKPSGVGSPHSTRCPRRERCSP